MTFLIAFKFEGVPATMTSQIDVENSISVAVRPQTARKVLCCVVLCCVALYSTAARADPHVPHPGIPPCFRDLQL